MMIAIIDYGMGNLRSVQKAIERMGGRAQIVSTPEEIERVRREVRETPTGEETFPARYRALIAWAMVLRDRGVPIGQALPRQVALEIDQLWRSGEGAEAARLLDVAFHRMEALAEGKGSGSRPEPVRPREVRVPVRAATVRVLSGLPVEEAGAEIEGKATFSETDLVVGG